MWNFNELPDRCLENKYKVRTGEEFYYTNKNREALGD